MSGSNEDFGHFDDGSQDEMSDSSWEDIDEDEKEHAPNCHPLLMNSLILEKIFDFLSTTNLLECRQVCREWNRTALLRTVLGPKFKITVSKANFDRLLKTAQNSTLPFCRKFEFRLLELEYDKVSKFIRLFGERLNRLSIKFCTASSAESVIKILNCPRLEELTIYGALPKINEENFHPFVFSRLKTVFLNSSLDYGQVSKEFIKILLKHAPYINTVNIGQSISLWEDFCEVIPAMTDSKLCHVGLSGIEGPLSINHFQNFLEKRLILRKINLQNCLVTQEFVEQLLLQTFKHVAELTINGTQQEILSTVFRDITLPNLKQITLPIDGISITDGGYLVQSCPSLTSLIIVGLFNTYFAFEKGRLISLTMKEKYFSTLFSRENLQQVMLQEKRREFRKVISLINLQPLKMEISLSVSFINSRCIRAAYARYPNLEHLVLANNSAKECLVSLCGIPYRLCKRMAYCKSFSVLYPSQVKVLTSISHLKNLKRLELTILDDIPTVEFTLLFVVYGICELPSLEELSLNNFKMCDVALMVLAQKLNLSHFRINGSEERWKQFEAVFKKHAIKSFLLPPPQESNIPCSPAEVVSSDRKILSKIFNHLDSPDIFEARKVCNNWRSFISNYLHQSCSSDGQLIADLEIKLSTFEKGCPQSPSNRCVYYLGETPRDALAFPKILKIWGSMTKETKLAIISLSRPALDFFQREYRQDRGRRTVSCQKRRQLEYWFYPDGSDDLVYCERPIKSIESLSEALCNIEVLLVVGNWGRKDSGILEFLSPLWSVSSLHLIGLHKDALDLVLPKLTLMMNLESLQIRPFINSSPYCDVTKTHLQILCNSSFKLRQLSLQFHAPSEAVVEFVRSQRFTLEIVDLCSNVNISDRLTFSMPQLKVLQLDEPPGCLLWTTLNVHSSLETINFGRSGCAYNQVKNKSSPKMDPLLDADFEHSATEILCDVNWFLENAGNRRTGSVHKSILQQGSDSALKFFMNFPYLASLTLRGVHAHYGILQGIFKKFTQLKRLSLINASGVTDEILTGFSKEILDEMDIMNPFQVKSERTKTKVQGKSAASIRSLKCLTHLSLDDQPLCTDFSIIFGILKLHQLEYLSCKKWKITDVALRALRDILPSLKVVNTEGCATVSKYALDYFNEKQIRPRLTEE